MLRRRQPLQLQPLLLDGTYQIQHIPLLGHLPQPGVPARLEKRQQIDTLPLKVKKPLKPIQLQQAADLLPERLPQQPQLHPLLFDVQRGFKRTPLRLQIVGRTPTNPIDLEFKLLDAPKRLQLLLHQKHTATNCGQVTTPHRLQLRLQIQHRLLQLQPPLLKGRRSRQRPVRRIRIIPQLRIHLRNTRSQLKPSDLRRRLHLHQLHTRRKLRQLPLETTNSLPHLLLSQITHPLMQRNRLLEDATGSLKRPNPLDLTFQFLLNSKKLRTTRLQHITLHPQRLHRIPPLPLRKKTRLRKLLHTNKCTPLRTTKNRTPNFPCRFEPQLHNRSSHLANRSLHLLTNRTNSPTNPLQRLDGPLAKTSPTQKLTKRLPEIIDVLLALLHNPEKPQQLVPERHHQRRCRRNQQQQTRRTTQRPQQQRPHTRTGRTRRTRKKYQLLNQHFDVVRHGPKTIRHVLNKLTQRNQSERGLPRRILHVRHLKTNPTNGLRLPTTPNKHPERLGHLPKLLLGQIGRQPHPTHRRLYTPRRYLRQPLTPDQLPKPARQPGNMLPNLTNPLQPRKIKPNVKPKIRHRSNAHRLTNHTHYPPNSKHIPAPTPRT